MNRGASCFSFLESKTDNAAEFEKGGVPFCYALLLKIERNQIRTFLSESSPTVGELNGKTSLSTETVPEFNFLCTFCTLCTQELTERRRTFLSSNYWRTEGPAQRIKKKEGITVMNREEAREQLKHNLIDYVEQNTTQNSKGGKGAYNCPICGSGNGKNGTGAFNVKDGVAWKCFACGAGGDVFDLYGALNGVSDYGEQFKGLCSLYNINIDNSGQQYTHNSIHTNTTPGASVQTVGAHQNGNTQGTTLKDFFLQAHSNIGNTDYWQKRGLSREIVNYFKLGYVENWKHPKAPNSLPSPRLIVPTGANSYLARDTREPENVPEQQKRFTKAKVGNLQIFNARALKESKKPVFIVEGEIDALSIIEAGGAAVALGTVTMTRTLIETVKAAAPAQPLIIALDNDTAGQRAAQEINEGLAAAGIAHYTFNPCGQYKDANEALIKDRDSFVIAVNEAENLQEAEARARKEKYLQMSTANYIQNFINGIADNVNTPVISTGFPKLNEALDGGLYEGLYIIGAISSLGKTTLITQISDQIAQAGGDVLIFSLEMARSEIMAKSISRHTLQEVKATGGNVQHAKTARGITAGKRYAFYCDDEKRLITKAIENYSQYAHNIYIHEGIGDIGVEQVRETVKDHILFTGKTPVVIIDYVQILAPYSDRATDKQNTDKAVMELKRISRDFKLPVIGISSFNRANYKEAVTMEAFKESGAIEYSSDVLLGLQLKGAGEKGFDATAAKQKNPREIELVVLKQRNGKQGVKVNFSFYPMFNFFEEA